MSSSSARCVERSPQGDEVCSGAVVLSASTRFADLAIASRELSETRSRLEKVKILVALLGRVPPDEIPAAVGWLVEEPMCGPLGVGPAHLWKLHQTAAPQDPTMTLADVEAQLAAARGAGRDEALHRVNGIFARLTAIERRLFVGALTASLRQGSLGGVMANALAERTGTTEADVRRAVMLHGSIVRAAESLLHPTPTADAGLALFRPLAPMLASPAESVAEALLAVGANARLEWKIDGVRAQVHKRGKQLAIYSRQGNDLTAGCAPLLDSLANLAADSLVLDGEVALLDKDGVTRPFQDAFSAVASKALRPGDRLAIYLFDCLHREGADLLDLPLSSRLEALEVVVPEALRVPSLVLASPDLAAAEHFYESALAAGQEGVVVKDLASPYRFGARGYAWQKVKRFTTVDLVILAAEWGSGRRRGFLSNLHLGARRSDGTFCMVGKTFKGLTDAMLAWQTERLQGIALEHQEHEHVVYVRPEVVVEIRFNDVQRSPRYPGGIALRFARVVRHRDDKPATEIEPLEGLVARLPESGPEVTGGAAGVPKVKQLSLFGGD